MYIYMSIPYKGLAKRLQLTYLNRKVVVASQCVTPVINGGSCGTNM